MFSEGDGKKYGRKKGTKNKSSLRTINWDEKEITLIKAKIMELVKSKNPTILKKFLDIMEYNAVPETNTDDEKKIPEIVINVRNN